MMKTPRQTWNELPKLVRFVALNSAIGIVIGWLIAAGLVWFNIMGFGDRFHNASNKIAVIYLLASSFGVTFGFGYLTTAVLLLPTEEDDFNKM
jgi:predicted membrane protein